MATCFVKERRAEGHELTDLSAGTRDPSLTPTFTLRPLRALYLQMSIDTRSVLLFCGMESHSHKSDKDKGFELLSAETGLGVALAGLAITV